MKRFDGLYGQALHVGILCSKSVYTMHFGVATAKTSRLYMYVYVVLEACARKSTLRRSIQALHVCLLHSKGVCTEKYTSLQRSS